MSVESQAVGIKKKYKNRNNKGKYIAESVAKNIFFMSALVAVVSLLLIIGFVFYKGLTPFISKGYSFTAFLTGVDWLPSSDKFGILPMIVASLIATVGSLIIGVPVGILTAVFIAEIAPKKVAKLMSPAVELLAGIPSVLYGIFGLAFIVPAIQNIFNLPKGSEFISSNNSFINNDVTNNNICIRNGNKSST